MAFEKNTSGVIDDFYSSSTNYNDDIERIRDIDSESVKTDSGRLGLAGAMAATAALALVLIGAIPGNLMDALHLPLIFIGFGASIYGVVKLLRKLAASTLSIPSINVLKKTMAEQQQTSRPYKQQTSTNQTTQKSQEHYPYSVQRKELRRSRSNRVVAGIAGGLGEFFGVSPALIRFAFIIATFATSGMFFFMYLLMALIIPKNYDDWKNKNRG